MSIVSVERFRVDIAQSNVLILPVIVLYKKKLNDSQTYSTLASQLPHRSVGSVVVYDNTSVAQALPDKVPVHVEYRRDYSNSGLAAAYNFALNFAHERGVPWLLLLDQDSELPPTFLEDLSSLLGVYSNELSVAAVVPEVRDHQRAISPKRVGVGRLRPMPRGSIDICNFEVVAINSGAAVRTSFLREIGGFNSRYWLDFLDFWLFRAIYSRGKTVAVSRCCIRHNLSVSDYRRNISRERYRSIVGAETLFITSEKGGLETRIYILRLLIRAIKQLIVVRRPELALMTLRVCGALMSRRNVRNVLVPPTSV